MTRQLIVVDTEVTCLFETGTPVPLEIAAVNVDSGAEFHMVPFVTPMQLSSADPKALQINKYYERGVWEGQMDPDTTKNAYGWLADMLRDNTLAGSNPSFDAQVLTPHIGRVWHHRLADLSAYACARMGLGLHEMPGQQAVCEFLGVANPEEHSALGDAQAAAECFRQLRTYYQSLAVAR